MPGTRRYFVKRALAVGLLALAVGLLMLVKWACNGPQPMAVTQVKVIDGDTFRAELGPPGSMPEAVRVVDVRLAGVDAPELQHKCASASWQGRLRKKAAEARARLAELLEGAESIELVEVRKGKHFRLVARVLADGVDVGDALLADKLVKAADDQARQWWCAPPE